MARKQLKPRVHICRNEDGSLISNEQEILDRWVRHFDKLLNGRKDNERVTFIATRCNQTPEGKTPDKTDAPLLKKLKNNKAPGTHSIPAELLRFAGDRLKQWLSMYFHQYGSMKKSPKDLL